MDVSQTTSARTEAKSILHWSRLRGVHLDEVRALIGITPEQEKILQDNAERFGGAVAVRDAIRFRLAVKIEFEKLVLNGEPNKVSGPARRIRRRLIRTLFAQASTSA